MNKAMTDQEFLEGFVDQHFDPHTVRWTSGGTVAAVSCPGPLHENGDRHPSATVTLGQEGRLLVYYCHVGCATEDVLEALSLTWADLWHPDSRRGTQPLFPPPRVLARTGWTADVLLSTTLPEPRWAVPGLLPAGLSVLAGAPKVGKSWLLLDVCLRVAMGSKVLGACDVEPGPTLYLALEDTPRRLQERMRRLLRDEPAPATAHLHTSWPRMGEGGADLLHDHLSAHPDTRVVAVDVLSRVRDIAGRDKQQYDADYEAMTAFKALADEFGTALLVNHHDRKAKDADWLTTVSGTRGVTGAADAVMLLTKPRGTADGQLSITGRDVEEAQRALRFDAGQWSLLDGPVEEYSVPATRARILALLREVPDLRPAEVAARLDGLTQDNARQTLSRMRDGGQVTVSPEGRYRATESRDRQEAVTPVTVSRQWGSGAVTSDSSDRSGTFTGPKQTVPMPVSVTGCAVEEWLSGAEQGFPVGLPKPALRRLADYCPECGSYSTTLPLAVTYTDRLTAFYCCTSYGHGWVSSHADLDRLWKETA